MPNCKVYIEFLGQAHWYLSVQISQDASFEVTLDQSRYCKAILNQFLETAGTMKNNKHHYVPLPSDFVPSIEDCAETKEKSKKIQEEFNVDFLLCMGALIYLAYTQLDIAFAIRKFSKSTQ